MNSHNKQLAKVWGSTCAICKRNLDPDKLNYEARIHHGATQIECKNRKECNRAKKKERTIMEGTNATITVDGQTYPIHSYKVVSKPKREPTALYNGNVSSGVHPKPKKHSSLLSRNNFNLSKEAEEYANKLIKRCKESEKQFGGIISKGNVKLGDDGEEL